MLYNEVEKSIIVNNSNTEAEAGLSLTALASSRPRLAVHDGPAHADDVLCVALLQILVPGLNYVRTRDEAILESCVRMDVGEGWLDHHGQRAARGVCALSRLVAAVQAGDPPAWVSSMLDGLEEDFQAVADADTGVGVRPGRFSCLRDRMAAEALKGADQHRQFAAGLELACRLLGDCAVLAQAEEAEREEAKAFLAEHAGEEVLVCRHLNRQLKPVAWETGHSAIYSILETHPGEWMVSCLADPASGEFSPFSSRLLLPEYWKGLRGEALSEASGIPGAVFCHQGRFCCAWDTEGGAVAAAKEAIRLSRSGSPDWVEAENLAEERRIFG